MPPKGKKHTTTDQHRAVLADLKARKDEAKQLLAGLRAARKTEDKRHSRLVKQAKKLNPADLLEIAAVTGITADQLRDMATRMGGQSNPPAEVPVPAAADGELQAVVEQHDHPIVVQDAADFPLVLAGLPDE